MKEEIEHEYTEEIVCPHCGFVHGDSWEVSGDDGWMFCDQCKEKFLYERQRDITYTTRKP